MRVKKAGQMDPELTVIITVVGGKECVRRCLEALLVEPSAAAAEILVPYDRWCLPVGELAKDFPDVYFHLINDLGAAESESISAREHRLYDRRRTVGLALARGRLIALTEDYAVPAPDWCSQILAAHEHPHAAIGGVIDNLIDRPLNWALYYCDFGRYGSPLQQCQVAYVSDVNVSYKREMLNRIRHHWNNEYRETTVHRQLRALGENLFLDPRLAVFQMRPPIGLFSALRERVEWARIFAQTRLAGRSFALRTLYALGSVFLPPVLLSRALRHMLRQRRSIKQIAFVLPLLGVLLIAWAAGEFWGYVRHTTHAPLLVSTYKEAEIRTRPRTPRDGSFGVLLGFALLVTNDLLGSIDALVVQALEILSL